MIANHNKNFYIKLFILWAVIGAVIFFVLLDNFRSYRSEMSVLVIPKNEISADTLNQILNNLTVISRYPAFSEALFASNPALHKIGNENFGIERINKSSVLKISVTDPDQNESKALSRAATLTLLNRAGFYYSIKTDLDFRIIDGPVTEASVKGFLWLIFLSLALGFILAYLLTYIFNGFRRAQKEKKYFHSFPKELFLSPFQKGEGSIQFTDDLEYPIAPKPQTKREPKIEPEISLIQRKKTEAKKPAALAVNSGRSSQAPGNLPFAETGYSLPPYIKGENKIKPDEKIAEPKTEDRFEPTDEEMKKRLNQLLKGEL